MYLVLAYAYSTIKISAGLSQLVPVNSGVEFAVAQGQLFAYFKYPTCCVLVNKVRKSFHVSGNHSYETFFTFRERDLKEIETRMKIYRRRHKSRQTLTKLVKEETLAIRLIALDY